MINRKIKPIKEKYIIPTRQNNYRNVKNSQWQRNIWNSTGFWDHKIDKDKFYHYSSIPYGDNPENKMQILKISVPKNGKNMPTVVWFHGGGFVNDNRECPKALYDSGQYIIVEPRYRLSPQSRAPDYHNDGAMALAWVLANIKEFLGDNEKIFVGGMSAGAYLAMIISMDKSWLNSYGFSYKNLAGIIAVSGQVSTHFIVQSDLNLDTKSKYAPLQYLSKALPPILLIVGDIALDIPGRVLENMEMAKQLRDMGHENIEYHSLKDKNHGNTFMACGSILLSFIDRIIKNN